MVLAFDPISKEAGGKTCFGADVAFITNNHSDYNGVDQVVYGEKDPFVITGPGDYEVKQIFIKGLLSKGPQKPKSYLNTIYSFEIDGLNVCFLGALSDTEIAKESRESISEPDILFVPVGGGEVIEPQKAAKLASSLEAKLVIPMNYDKESLKAFLKEMGEEGAEAVDKLTLKKKDVDGKEGSVVVVKPSK